MWIPDSEFAFNLQYVEKYLESGFGIEMGCGCAPLVKETCLLHVDISPQPLAVEQVGHKFVQDDASLLDGNRLPMRVDWVFSSHMLEDLPSVQDMIVCLNKWLTLLNPAGHIVLLMPDIEGGRYPTVAEGGNPSHRVDIGPTLFANRVAPFLIGGEVVQLDTIPRDKSCTFDVVIRKKW